MRSLFIFATRDFHRCAPNEIYQSRPAVSFFLFLFMCVSEPASVQMRLFYEEHLILFAALIN
jgi:hypothetical protein